MWNTSEGDPNSSFSANDVSLENLLSPFSYGQQISLPDFQPGAAIHSQNSRGFISQDCQWGCCYCRNSIKCFPVDSYGTSGQYVSKGRVPVTVSTTSYSFPSSTITCATEVAIHNHKTVLGIRKILLGLKVREGEDLVGAVVIFDPLRCLPMKWISLPSPVSSVTVLSHYEESGFARPFFNEAMLTMVGVAAVGMQGGQVVIVDLGLDDPNLSNWDSVLTPGIHRYRVMPVDPHELLIATKRHNLVTRNNLICVDLTCENDEESENENDYYYYCSPERNVLCALEKSTISVTCLEYIPAIGSLIVGYSFGCFQIWGVDSAALLYSSPVPSTDVTNEVFGFAFLQPEDDPKNICYLWVLFGKQTLEMHYSHAELFGLLYNNKPYSENFGYIYEEFLQCSRRLSIRMEDFFDTGGENSMEEQPYPLQRYSVRPIRIWSHSDRLTFFSWESNRNGVYYVGIFDLNQWYSNHASEKVRYSSIGLCPYWVAIPVETVDRFATVWDVGIVPKSIESWENPHSKIDLHLYPASITFRGVCLSSSGTSTFEFFGIQEKLLRVLQRKGPDLMVDPGEFKSLCQMYGLEPVMSHCYDDLASQLDADRYFILTVLLESRRSSFILEMANKWIDGSYVNVGCSVDLILSWVSSFTCAIRSVADQHWENLLTFRNEVLPPETAHFINYSNFIWHALLGVLNMLMRPNEVYESQTDDLENLKFLLEKFVQYSAALLMFYKAGILPEVDDHQFVPMMLKYYEQRRMDVKGALQNCDLLDPEIKSSHTLLIDYLLENFDEQLLREQWNLEPEDSLYPPKHIGYILNMFMWAHEYPKAISRIIAYYLIDLSFIINETVKLRGDFASIIQLSTEEQTEIYNLWALDHGSCHEVLLFLSQKDHLHESDGLPWCAAVVLLTALGHGESIVELLQKSCPPKLGRLYFNLMTTSRTKYNFLIDDICSTPALMESSHLRNFFEVSDKHNLLGEFVKAKSCSAPTVVTDSLVEYLQSHSNFENCDRLLSYYIHKEDWEKLREQYESVKTQSYVWKLSKHQRSVWQVRQRLVESLLKPTRQDFQKFVSDGSPQVVHVSGPSRKIKIHHVKRPYTLPSPLNEFRANKNVANEIKLPPQLRNLKLHAAKSSCSLSPMRSQSGFLHAVIGGNTGGDKNSTPKSVRDVSAASIRILSSSPDTPNSSLGRRKSFRSTSRISLGGRSPINLVALLKTPAVDHRVSRRESSQTRTSDMTMNNDDSVYGTPSSDQSCVMSKSIMKKHDSLRKFVCRKGLRFSNNTFRGDDEDDSDDTDYSKDKDIPLGIQKLEKDSSQLSLLNKEPMETNVTTGREIDISARIEAENRPPEPAKEIVNDEPFEDEQGGMDSTLFEDEENKIDEDDEDEYEDSEMVHPIVTNSSFDESMKEELPAEGRMLNAQGGTSVLIQPNMTELLFDDTTRSVLPIAGRALNVLGDRRLEERNQMEALLEEECVRNQLPVEEKALNVQEPILTQPNITELFESDPTRNFKPIGGRRDLYVLEERLEEPNETEESAPNQQPVEEKSLNVQDSVLIQPNMTQLLFDETVRGYMPIRNQEESVHGNRRLVEENFTEALFEESIGEDIPSAERTLDNETENSVEEHSKSEEDNNVSSEREEKAEMDDALNQNVHSADVTLDEDSFTAKDIITEDEQPKINEPLEEDTNRADVPLKTNLLAAPEEKVEIEHPKDEVIVNPSFKTTVKPNLEEEPVEILEIETPDIVKAVEEISNKADTLTKMNSTNEQDENEESENVENDAFNDNIKSSDVTIETDKENGDQESFAEPSNREDVTIEETSQNGQIDNSKLNEAILDEDNTIANDSEEKSVTSSPPAYLTRSQLRRRSCTPDSERSFRSTGGDFSEKRVTRSQARRESEFDVSGSEGSIFDTSPEVSPKTSRKVRGTRSIRSRSKTPLPLLPVVVEDQEMKIESLVETPVRKEKTTKRKERKPKEPKTPSKEPKTTAKELKTPVKEPQTPVKEPQTPVKDEPSSDTGSSSKKSRRKSVGPVEQEVVKEKRKTSKRKTKQTEEEKSPVKEEVSPADGSSDKNSSKSTAKRKRRQLQTYDYTPGLSTIVEDSDQSLSIMQATLLPPVLSPPKSRGKRTPKKTPTKSIASIAAAVVGAGKSSRGKVNDLESDDDSKSDISATSSRSMRSTSTPELSIFAESDQSFSMLNATVTEPKLPSPRKLRGRSKEPTVSPTIIIDDLGLDKVKPVKRRKKNVDSDDDAQSDISVASSRSTRSTASTRRSTERTLPKRTTRSSKK